MKRVSLLAVVLLLATPALAVPIVEINVVLDGAGNFALWADATKGDANGGIAGFNLTLDSYVSANNQSPKYLDGGVGAFVGFTQGANTFSGAAAPPLNDIFDGQNTSNTATVLYDVGILPGGTGAEMFPRGTPWAAPVLLAEGVGTPDYTQCVGGVNVFTAVGANTVLAAQVNWVPEPATLALLGLGGLAILRRRR